MKRTLLAAALAALAFAAPAGAAVAPGADAVPSLPTLGPVATPQFAGYASADATDCADLLCSDRAGLFYWLAGRTADYRTQPTILWSNGGPGASSMYGFLNENGPYNVGPDGNLVPFVGSWTSVANYLAFDHPLGVGMSFPFKGQISHGVQQGADQLAHALTHVVARDGLQQSPLFLTGESYGGTYMPLLAKRLLDTHAPVKLGGVVLADGWIAPETQVGTSAQYAVTHGLIDADQKRALDRVYARCRADLKRLGTGSGRATDVCSSIQDKIAAISGRWLGNIGQAADIDYTPIATYLNRPDVRAAIHANPQGTFELGSDAIFQAYKNQQMRDYTWVVANLLNRGIPVMVLTGLNDAKDANFLGQRAWTSKLKWRGSAAFARAGTKRWTIDGQTLGYRRTGGGLTTLEVLDAGHLAPRDQPRIADAMADFIAAAPSS
jgi:carboxypeptidase C (cathepsin A)